MAGQVDQGNGSPMVEDWSTSIAARFVARNSEVVVTNAAGGSLVPATPLTQRKAVLLQNLGPNAIYITLDGSAPVVGSNGIRLEAATATSAPVLRLDIGDRIIIRAIAATAAQVSGAALQVVELR